MVGLYLVSAAVAAVVGVVTDDIEAFWLAVVWSPQDESFQDFPDDGSSGGAPGLIPLLVLKAWMLWQVFTVVSREGRLADRRVIWLRCLLYLAVAGLLILWLPIGSIPGVLGEIIGLVVWGPIQVLFVLILTGASGRFRAVALIFAGLSLVAMVVSALEEISGVLMPRMLLFLGVAALAWQVMILIGQREDGRWSAATVTIGRIALLLSLATPLIGIAAHLLPLLTPLVLGQLVGEFNVFNTVWLARSAHELAESRTPVASRGGRPPAPPRAVLATAVLLPLFVVIQPEQTPRLAYGGWAEECPGCSGAIAAREPGPSRSGAEARPAVPQYVAETNARCADPWPGLRARRQGTAAYLLSEGGGYHVYDFDDDSEDGAFEVAVDDGFVGAVGSSAAVMTYGENEPMCLTVKAFGSAPPPRLRGWDQVAEVGIVSRSGHLGVPRYSDGGDEGAGARLPNLAVKGAGRYRLRVYAREAADFEEHLVVVFPGRSTKKIVYRPVPR
ncbi:hypothetical protein ACSDR0_34885 [Streptosporangium sp. G11]|uniref:hypothetical protein n=1 Tax=Streptosporangium sp. G11 TaxID=3436926 RepID=UPI003EB9BE80